MKVCLDYICNAAEKFSFFPHLLFQMNLTVGVPKAMRKKTTHLMMTQTMMMTTMMIMITMLTIVWSQKKLCLRAVRDGIFSIHSYRYLSYLAHVIHDHLVSTVFMN